MSIWKCGLFVFPLGEWYCCSFVLLGEVSQGKRHMNHLQRTGSGVKAGVPTQDQLFATNGGM